MSDVRYLKKGTIMNFKIDKVRVSIDLVTMSSDDRRKIKFSSKIFKGYRNHGLIPTKGNKEDRLYENFHELSHLETGNKVHIYKANKNTYYLPNIVIKFYSSWDHKLSYEEVISVLNQITEAYNLSFNLAEYHMAIDLFSKKNYLKSLVSYMKSGRNYDPEEHPKYPGTHYFQSPISYFYLIAYDKKKQLLDKKHRKRLSQKSIKELNNCNVARIEARFHREPEIKSLEDLATHCFQDLIPNRIEFLIPDHDKLAKKGIKRHQNRNKGLDHLRNLLEKMNVTNFWYYTQPNSQLTNLVEDALRQYRWCINPNDYPLIQPKIIIRPQKIRFIKH